VGVQYQDIKTTGGSYLSFQAIQQH